MPTTCPCCGMRSSAKCDACRLCGHELYRVAYPATRDASPSRIRAARLTPTAARLVLSGAALAVGAGVLAGLMAGSGDGEEPVSGEKVPATALPREPTATPEPTSPKPSKTKAPPTTAPATTTPPASTQSPKPPPTGSSPAPSIPGMSEAEWARLAEDLAEKYGTPNPGHTYWERHGQGEYEYHYEYSYGHGYEHHGTR
jgi:hypothetical protein